MQEILSGYSSVIWEWRRLHHHLGDEEGAHSRASAASQGVGELEALGMVADTYRVTCIRSQFSASFLTTSSTFSTSSAPSV